MKIIRIFRFSILALLLLQTFSISFVLADEKANEQSKANKEKHHLTEIIITADPFNHSLLEHSSPASVIRDEELISKTEITIGETVGKEPGVSSSYFGPGASRPVIRGNAGDRVRVLKNGIGTLDVSNTSEDHAVSTNPLAAESIEILRGPETLLFGSSAIGGIVNVTDNAIPEKEIDETIAGSFDLRHGTADDELSGAIKLEGQIEKFNWHLNYYHQDTNDTDIPGNAESSVLRQHEVDEGESHEEDEESYGKLPNSSTRSQGGTAGGSYIWDKGFLGISISGSESNYGVPGHAHGEEEHGHEEEEHGEEEHGEEGVAIDMEQTRFDIRGRVDDIGETLKTAKFKFGYSNYEHKELEGGKVGSKFENDALEARVELIHTPILSLEGVLGFQFQASDFSAIGDEAFLPPTETISPSIFLFEELEINDFWKIQAGARYDFVKYDADGFLGDEFHPFGFSTGFAWDPTGKSDYTVGLSFAYTQRSPSATELYANGPHAARQIFEMGNSDLRVEESYGFDLTMKKNLGLFTGAINLFVQDYDSYINLMGRGEEDGLPAFYYESTRALFSGFEAEATFHMHEALDLWTHEIDIDVQVDYVRAEDKSINNDLPRIPPLRTIVGLDYQYKFLFDARVEGVFVSNQNKVADFELPTDSYQMLNTHLNINLPTYRDKKLIFYVRGSNLTDEEARVHTSFIKDLAPLRGRNLLFGVKGFF